MSFAGPKTDEMLAWCDRHKQLPRLYIMGDRGAKKSHEFTLEEAEEIRHGKWLFRIIRAYRILKRVQLYNIVLKDRKKAALGDMTDEIAAKLDHHIPKWRTKL